jgi:formate dehydrogenase iron-sulfur subunit
LNGAGTLLLYFLVGLGFVLAIWRFASGIGSISNLNQGYPWGFWIGFDILAGIALAAGGFVVAGLVHIFRVPMSPAIFTALWPPVHRRALVDIGRPWTFWQMIIYWHHGSPMFEVGWCVMMYTTVLILEFAPVILEKWRRADLLEMWRKFVPWVAWGLLTIFTFAMTHSGVWTAAISGVLLYFNILVSVGAIRRDPDTPTILIMAGIIFSTMHQSSLGTVFTMVPHKLHALWFSPILPVLFFLSAVMAGLAMVIIESMWSAKHFKREPETHLLRGIARGLTWMIVIYMTVNDRSRGARRRGRSVLILAQALAFWFEISVGLVIPLAPHAGETWWRLFWSAMFVVVGLIANRLNVAITGIDAAYPVPYMPRWSEIAVSVGIVSLGVLVYREVAARFPILGGHGSAHGSPDVPRGSSVFQPARRS